MSDLLVRHLDAGLLARLKRRAAEHHRTLQEEIRFILREAADRVGLNEDVRVALLRVRQELAATGPTPQGRHRGSRSPHG